MEDNNELFAITVKTTNSTDFQLSVSSSTTVDRLKEQIFEVTSITEDRQRLIFRGQVLESDRSLSHYSIENGHAIHMVARPENFREIQSSSYVNTNSVPPPLPSASGSSTAPSRTNDILNVNQSNTNLEHIRQGLQTLNTLFSVMASTTNSSNDIDSLSSPNETSVENSEIPQRENARNIQFYVGQWIDAKDTVNQWLEATILRINEENNTILIHYNGWPVVWDEWIDMNSPRIAPFRTRSYCSVQLPHQSPAPNFLLRSPPLRPAEDLRRIIPSISDVLHKLVPFVDRASELCSQSIDSNSAEESQAFQAAMEDISPLFDRLGRVLTDMTPHINRMVHYDTNPSSANGSSSIENVLADSVIGLRRSQTPPRRQAFRSPVQASRAAIRDAVDLHIAIFAPHSRPQRTPTATVSSIPSLSSSAPLETLNNFAPSTNNLPLRIARLFSGLTPLQENVSPSLNSIVENVDGLLSESPLISSSSTPLSSSQGSFPFFGEDSSDRMTRSPSYRPRRREPLPRSPIRDVDSSSGRRVRARSSRGFLDDVLNTRNNNRVIEESWGLFDDLRGNSLSTSDESNNDTDNNSNDVNVNDSEMDEESEENEAFSDGARTRNNIFGFNRRSSNWVNNDTNNSSSSNDNSNNNNTNNGLPNDMIRYLLDACAPECDAPECDCDSDSSQECDCDYSDWDDREVEWDDDYCGIRDETDGNNKQEESHCSERESDAERYFDLDGMVDNITCESDFEEAETRRALEANVTQAKKAYAAREYSRTLDDMDDISVEDDETQYDTPNENEKLRHSNRDDEDSDDVNDESVDDVLSDLRPRNPLTLSCPRNAPEQNDDRICPSREQIVSFESRFGISLPHSKSD